MFRVFRQIDFCYGHRLLNYEGKCRHLHGHNGRVVITFEAAGLDERGMVFDFGDIRRAVRRWIDEELDHRMILNRDDPVVPLLKQLGEPVCLLETNPTAENIARLIFDFAARQGFPVVEVRLWETPGCCAAYCRERAPNDIISTREADSMRGGVRDGDRSAVGPKPSCETPPAGQRSQEEPR